MITYGKCPDGKYRIRRPGSPFVHGSVFDSKDLAAAQAKRFAAGGRVVETVFQTPVVESVEPIVEPEADDASIGEVFEEE